VQQGEERPRREHCLACRRREQRGAGKHGECPKRASSGGGGGGRRARASSAAAHLGGMRVLSPRFHLLLLLLRRRRRRLILLLGRAACSGGVAPRDAAKLRAAEEDDGAARAAERKAEPDCEAVAVHVDRAAANASADALPEEQRQQHVEREVAHAANDNSNLGLQIKRAHD